MIDKVTILSAKEKKHTQKGSRKNRAYVLRWPPTTTCPPLGAIMLDTKRHIFLTDLLLQLFNLFIIKPCLGVQGDSFLLNYNHFSSSSHSVVTPMWAHFLFTSSNIQCVKWTRGDLKEIKSTFNSQFLALQVLCESHDRVQGFVFHPPLFH